MRRVTVAVPLNEVVREGGAELTTGTSDENGLDRPEHIVARGAGLGRAAGGEGGGTGGPVLAVAVHEG